jgi:hypothetical protein
MAADYETELNSVLDGEVPEWFFELSPTTRNDLYSTALTEYTTVTAAKNVTFLTYWAVLIAPYEP